MENSYFNELALLTHASTEVIIALAKPSCWSTFRASIVSIHKAMDVPSIIIGEQNLKKQHHFAPPQKFYIRSSHADIFCFPRAGMLEWITHTERFCKSFTGEGPCI